MSEEQEPKRVYSQKDWRELTGQPLPNLPATAVMCAAIKDSGDPCGNKAMHGLEFCRHHGGNTLAVQDMARRRIEAVRSELFEHLVMSARDAVETYTTIMKTGKRDADRLKAADRVLELLGMGDDVAQLPHQQKEESEIDKQLAVLLVHVTNEKLQRAMETTVIDAEVIEDEHDTGAVAEPEPGREDEAEVDPPSEGEAAHS